jgi:predicted acyltransferase
MIIVNTPGSGATPFAPLLHASWHGFTPTDLVFPSFLFAVGNAMSFSMDKYKSLGEGAFLGKILKRTILIFLLGYLMYWFPFFATSNDGNIALKPFGDTRVMGVLQRIALCYFFASILIRYLSARMVAIVSIILLVGYYFILLALGDPADPFSMTGNAGSLMDNFLFNEGHLYHGEGVAFEPEGLLGTIPAIVNVIIGFYAGNFIRLKGKNYETVSKLFLAGGALILMALAWNTFFPINKKLWSSPFVLLTTGIDLTILGALIYIVEIRYWNKWNWTRFFTIFGKNPLFIYLLSELLITVFYLVKVGPDQNIHSWVNNIFFQRIAPGAIGSLLFAIVYMLLCWSVGWWLDKKKIYVKV